jgi:HlyD family secretion protein
MFRKKKAKDKEIQNTFVDEHIDLSDDWSEEESLKDREKLEDLEELEDLDSKDDEKDSKEKEKKSNTFDVGDGEYMIEDEKKISGKKIAAIVAGVLLLAGVGIFFLVKNMGAGEDSKVYVESVGVITGLSSANGGTNRYTGEVEAQESWKITLDADMSVEECYVKVGDEVKKDDKLFK